MNRKLVGTIALLLTVGAWSTVPQAAEPEEIRYASDPWPPYNVGKADGSALQGGYTADFLDALGERLGTKIVSRLYPWKRVLAYLQQGTYDITFPIQHKAERETFLLFSDVVVEDRVFVWHLKSRNDALANWQTVEDLKPFTIGVIDGYTQGVTFDKAIADKAFTIEVSASSEANLKKLLGGRMDGVLEVESVAESYFRQHPEWRERITHAPTVVNVDRYRIGISRKSPVASMLPRVNDAVRDLRTDGTVARIMGQ